MGYGGIFGSGLGHGQPFWTPLVQSDFIFTAFGEELGLTGLMAMLLLFGLVVQRGLRAALAVRDPFAKLLAGGLSFALALQIFIIVGGVTQLIPLTGITTPFLSGDRTDQVVQYREPIQLRHLHIQKNQVEASFFNCLHRSSPVLSFQNSSDHRLPAQQIHQPQSRRRLASTTSKEISSVRDGTIAGLSCRTICRAEAQRQTNHPRCPPRRRRTTKPLAPFGCSPPIRSRVTDNPNPAPLSSVHPGGRPTPSSETRSSNCSSTGCAETTTVPPVDREEIPWRIAFSMSGCTTRQGTSAYFTSGDG